MVIYLKVTSIALLLCFLWGCAVDNTTPKTPERQSKRLSLQDDFDSINIGDTHSQVLQLMGRSPDLTYKATDGSGATVLQYKDSDVNVVRFMLTDDIVSKVTYVPSAGGIEAAQIK